MASMSETRTIEATPGVDMSNDITWKKHYQRVKCQMAVSSLKLAIRRKDRAMLQRALHDCQLLEVKPEVTPEVAQGQRMLAVLEFRQNLLDAIASDDADRLQGQLRLVAEGNLRKSLLPECRKAENALQRLQQHQERRNSLMDLSCLKLSELRSYRAPVPVLHRVLQAAFLLLGMDEKTTADWGTCKRLALARGHMTLLQWVEEAENQEIHPELAARAAEILSYLDPEAAKDAGVAAFTFFVWAKGKLDVIQDSLQGVPPADIPRQRELLGRTTPPEPEHMPYLKRNKERRRRQSQRRSRTLSMDTTSVTIRDNTPGVARVEDTRSALDSDSPHVDTMESGALRKRIRQTSPDTQRGFLPPIVPD